MITRILVSVDRFETRVAITEGDRVTECHIERRGYRSVVGHVWKGRVENVLAGMEAAFVDVGLEKGGFLHIDEVVAIGVPKRRRQIADLLKKGDEIIVQATKDPMGTKGARLSMQLASSCTCPTAAASASASAWTRPSATASATSAPG
jgi:Rne/Rng family ribonuclease